ncbi:hypothetical protein [Vibrio salinus]|uniref:hypothetical protein n=1 Tax=Vibrio salinus TaxID=2899784 RepID=UPI001E4E45AE|nr:hypothetical protein [Vibrio salinus]MCE0495016.1 hypothetical protein [Vibrio salinus]
MRLMELSDSEIIRISKPMIDDVIKGSNEKNWALFLKHQTLKEASCPENRLNVEKQWEENEFLTSLSTERQILGVLRRDGYVNIIWKQTSTKVTGDFLAIYSLEEIDHEIKEAGFRIL